MMSESSGRIGAMRSSCAREFSSPLAAARLRDNLRHHREPWVGRLDERPPPHFHATYGDFDIEVSIDDGVVAGKFPKRALRHVLEWYDLHKDELHGDWVLASRRKPLKKMAPLE